MCGIVGRAGTLSLADERMFKVMLLLDYFRGQDSTGVASVTKGGSVSTLKMADDPIMLFNNRSYEETVSGPYDAIWIGHNRAATIGATSRENAHPFTCGHITGVHNGTLTKSSFNTLKSYIEQDYDTDSQTVFQNIADYGVEETIKHLQGAWALVWFDSKEKTLNMIRNTERPLFTCTTTRGDTKLLSWASEYEMIAAAREMSGSKSAEKIATDEDGFAYFPLPVDMLHTWTLQQILAGDFTPKLKELKGKPKDLPITTQSSGGTYTSGTVYTEKKDKYESVVIEEPLDDDLILGEFDSRQWDELTQYGCAVCNSDIDHKDEGLLVCVNEGVVLCPKCSEVSETTIVNSYSHALAAAM